MKLRTLTIKISLAGLACVATSPRLVDSAIASPFPFRLKLKGGGMTPELVLHGGPSYHYMTDTDGYTVIEDDKSDLVYATKDKTNGKLVSSGMAFGKDNPEEKGIQKKLVSRDVPTRRLDETNLHRDQAFPANQARQLSSAPMLKNLVILIRFSDHRHRDLPTVEDITTLFNQEGGDPLLAPTGSVRDVFKINSYGKFTLDSEIFDWVDLPQTESYYADGVSGYDTDRYFEALEYALSALDGTGINWADFDADGDNRVDMVTLIHSGYAAEVPGLDPDGAAVADRIWSHRWRLPYDRYWPSSTAPLVTQYSTSPSLFDLSGSLIGRVGVIAHEIGHCLGLDDLYGTPYGNGAGAYDIMSNHWGFAPYALRQFYPPHMSPWSKIEAGWLEPILIDTSGTYTVEASARSESVYRIDLNEHGTEYLLIENRQPIDFDLYLPQGGLAIWHIDEGAPNTEGYPGQPGPWPDNGKHYTVALLQADGAYDLEYGNDHGDPGDMFHRDGIDFLDPSTNPGDGPFPNTDAYHLGLIRNTGVRILDISSSAMIMSFSVEMLDPSTPLNELRTTFFDNNGAAGNMFDVLPIRNVTVHKLDLHVGPVGATVVEIWTKAGTYVSFEKNPMAWTRLVVEEFNGQGQGASTALEVGEIALTAGERRAFYVLLSVGKLRYTNGGGVGSIVTANDDLVVYEGVGKASPFGFTFNNRIWNGVIYYTVTPVPNENIHSIETTYAGGTGQAGNMFDVWAKQDISIRGFELHILDQTEVTVEMFTKEGQFAGFERDCEDWELVASTTVIGAGFGKPTNIPVDTFNPILIARNSFQAFYITVSGSAAMRYTPGGGFGTVYVEDEYIAIHTGAGVAYRCGATFWNRVWNGAIHYEPSDPGLGLAPGLPRYQDTNDTKQLGIDIIGWGDESSADIQLATTKAVMLETIVVILNATNDFTVQLNAAATNSHNSWTTLWSSTIVTKGHEEKIILESNALRLVLQEHQSINLVLNVTGCTKRRKGKVGRVQPASNEDMVISDSHQHVGFNEFPNSIVAQAILKYLVVDML